jgi:hypothetical protein
MRAAGIAALLVGVILIVHGPPPNFDYANVEVVAHVVKHPHSGSDDKSENEPEEVHLEMPLRGGLIAPVIDQSTLNVEQ